MYIKYKESTQYVLMFNILYVFQIVCKKKKEETPVNVYALKSTEALVFYS